MRDGSKLRLAGSNNRALSGVYNGDGYGTGGSEESAASPAQVLR
jgi:hypothetical protein